jgi:NADH-ubiquinone oxidoreductase chain 4
MNRGRVEFSQSDLGLSFASRRLRVGRLRFELIKLFICKIYLIALLFILIGIFGAKNKIRAGYYIFLYTLLGSLFLLLALLELQGFIGIISFDLIFKVIIGNPYLIALFCGIFIAFAVKTPTIFLNN